MTDAIAPDKIMIAIPATELERQPGTREWFVQRIRYRLLACVEAVLEIGETLIQAKADLPHGDFEAMVRDDLGWSPQTARKFMAIARHPVLSNRAHCARLPPSWGTLAELARVKPEMLEKAIGEGVVRPDMTRDDTRSVLYPKPPTHEPGFYVTDENGKPKRLDFTMDDVAAGRPFPAEDLPQPPQLEPPAEVTTEPVDSEPDDEGLLNDAGLWAGLALVQDLERMKSLFPDRVLSEEQIEECIAVDRRLACLEDDEDHAKENAEKRRDWPKPDEQKLRTIIEGLEPEQLSWLFLFNAMRANALNRRGNLLHRAAMESREDLGEKIEEYHKLDGIPPQFAEKPR